MRVAPITIALAKQIVFSVHRRAANLEGAMWACGLVVDGVVVGCAVVGRPKARRLDARKSEPKERLEVVRVAVPEGHRNACSMLYGACSRAARALGARDLLTYTHADEPGTSLRASGWIRDEESNGTPIVTGGGQWSRAGRPREKSSEDGPKHRWWAPWSVSLATRTEAA